MPKIPPTRYSFPEESINFVLKKFREILETRAFLTAGKYCEEFERKFASYIGTRYAVSVNSGTAALEVIFRALDVNDKDIIIPTNTFAATAFAAVRAGARPIFADCTNDLTVSPEDVERKITDKTKVVVTVHIGGLVSPYTYELKKICKDKGIYLVEDAAQAHGSTLNNKKAGTFGIAGGFSFFPTKVMTTGEGGMIVTDSKEIYDKSQLLADQAKVGGRNYHELIGYNWRMTEFQALLGITQLEHLESFIKERIRIAQIYNEGFKEIPSLKPLEIPNNVRHNYYKYIVFVPKGFDRESLSQRLRKEYNVNLSGYVYELPCHLQPVFKRYWQESLPVSEDLCSRHICPPVYVAMKDEEAVYVVDSIKGCLE